MLARFVNRPCPADADTLAQVERTIATGVRGLRFAGGLKQRFEADTRRRRARFLSYVGIGGGLVYNCFVLSDWLLLRDAFGYVAMGRLCLITPMIIGLLLLNERLSRRWALEAVAATGTVVASLLPMLAMIYSDSPYRLHYQLGMLLLMVYCTMIQRLPLRFAAGAILCMLAIQLVTTHVAGFLDFVAWQANALLYLSTAVLLLMASYFLEHGERLSYLFALRGRLLQAQLTEMARTDPLTGLFNRRYQGEVIAALWEQALSEPTPVAVILLDIDHFKPYNDNYGHLKGDTCLKRLSAVIQQTAQEAGALAFRFGGEEILVLMAAADLSQVRGLGEALRAAVVAMDVPHQVLGTHARVTISLGVANGVAPFVSADALIGAADSALYLAKHAGRDCLRCAPPEAVGG
jgi:diguanylate cyclase (GGDEF)-like protein